MEMCGIITIAVSIKLAQALERKWVVIADIGSNGLGHGPQGEGMKVV